MDSKQDILSKNLHILHTYAFPNLSVEYMLVKDNDDDIDEFDGYY